MRLKILSAGKPPFRYLKWVRIAASSLLPSLPHIFEAKLLVSFPEKKAVSFLCLAFLFFFAFVGFLLLRFFTGIAVLHTFLLLGLRLELARYKL